MNYNSIIDYYYTPDGNNALRNILLTHSRGVADLAMEIVERHPELESSWVEEKANYGVETSLRETVEIAAMLHDIGICKCDAHGIECYGSEPYILHGRIGAEMLRTDGKALGMTQAETDLYSRVCERHTGAGITAEDIERQGLPLPKRNFLPETIVEKIVCYADKFFSKTHPDRRKTYEAAERSLAKFGEEGVMRFRHWKTIFD